jgi:DNA-binding SARP family transcriptional activator
LSALTERPVDHAQAEVRLVLLGDFELTSNDTPIALARPCQRMLALLALHDRALERGFVAATLWTEAGEERAAGNLRSALWRLRQTGLALLEHRSSRIRLARSVAVDLHDACSLAHRFNGERDRSGDADVDESLFLRDLLPDWYDDWLLIERERFRELRLRALESLCERLAASGRHSRAIECALAAIIGDPLRESSHRAVIQIYLAEGNQAEALHQYRLYRELLAGRLGLQPSQQMSELVADLAHR